MDLGKFFVAIGISLLLFFFVANTLSLVYKAPKPSSSGCYNYDNTCYAQTSQQLCGSSQDYNCTSQIYQSQSYKDCTANQRTNQQSCLENQRNSLKVYQTVYYIILAFVSLLLMLFGFLLIEKRSIGAGFIGGGVLILLFANIFSAISVLVSSLFGALGSMTGFAVNSGASTPAVAYLNVVFSFIGLLMLIVFAYFKLEKVETNSI